MRIAIMGSGGVGGYVGARLQAAGADVAFIARGAHLKAMQAEGLRIEMPGHPLHLPQVLATDDPAAIGPVDLVIFAVKLGDTAAAARTIRPLLASDTRVLTLQNGIDSVAMIEDSLPGAHVLGGVIYVSAVIDRPGVIRSPGGLNRIVLDAARGDAVALAFGAACGRATALAATLTDDIGTAVWEKFVALTSIAGATSLMRAPMGLILEHPQTRQFQRQLIDECVAVARASGQSLRPALADEVMDKLSRMPGSFRSSMSEDLERGKPLELNWLSGRVHSLGAELGVPTPAHTAVVCGLILHAQGTQPGLFR
jgi:2-dehydropantoate 2-reductase